MLKAMKDAGCDRVHYGVESGNDRMLKVIKPFVQVVSSWERHNTRTILDFAREIASLKIL